MFYPAVDYLVIILLLAFLMVTLFACIFCLRHEYIRKESENEKGLFKKKNWISLSFHGSGTTSIMRPELILPWIKPSSWWWLWTAVCSVKIQYNLTYIWHKNITEAALYENGIVTRKLTLHRHVSDDRPAGVPSKQPIRTIRLCIRQKDHTDDISFILYQGRLEQRGHNYTIIKGKANSVILLLKMLLTNKI